MAVAERNGFVEAVASAAVALHKDQFSIRRPAEEVSSVAESMPQCSACFDTRLPSVYGPTLRTDIRLERDAAHRLAERASNRSRRQGCLPVVGSQAADICAEQCHHKWPS